MPELQSLSAQDKPLNGVVVLDFSQFLAGPVSAMRLSDLGARVIKVERPGTGDIGRGLAFAGIEIDGDTLSFHVMNRGKESFAADLKQANDLAEILKLVEKADVVIENFRPGVMQRLGLSYETLSAINPRLIYLSITGYGPEGAWSKRPGQDLLAQSMSGLPNLNGSSDDPPIAVGIALADIITSIHAAHGVTAALYRREKTGKGARIETSLMESMLDLQFELLSAHLTDPSVTVKRGVPHTAHPFLQAPYGIYKTSNGNIAIAMTSVPELGRLVGLESLEEYEDPATWWSEQSAITNQLASHLTSNSTEHWLEILDAADVWCAPVLELPQLVEHDGFKELSVVQPMTRISEEDGKVIEIKTTRSPIRIDGKALRVSKGAPRIGEHTQLIRNEFLKEQTNA
jgi:crotonobetainyl-CoA:carnitine CoA-transferase CaiB-like acyl-CoA transferase